MKEIYFCEEEANEIMRNRFIQTRCRQGWEVGDTIDVFAGPNNIGMTATVTEIQGNQCVLEIW